MDRSNAVKVEAGTRVGAKVVAWDCRDTRFDRGTWVRGGDGVGLANMGNTTFGGDPDDGDDVVDVLGDLGVDGVEGLNPGDKAIRGCPDQSSDPGSSGRLGVSGTGVNNGAGEGTCKGATA